MMETTLFFLFVIGLTSVVPLILALNKWMRKTTGTDLSSRKQLICLSICLCIGALAYQLLHVGHIEQTAALFVGLPTLLSILLSLTPRAESATGMIMKGITLGLLMSGIVLSEGLICILMAAPLFYLVGLLIGVTDDKARQRKKNADQRGVLSCVILLPLWVMSLEEASLLR